MKTTKIENFCRLGIFSKNSKKAQMEIMGLAIIIILVALAMLFVVQFVILKPQPDIKKAFTHKELAVNTVNTLLATTTECRDLSLSQLLKDCAEGGVIQCTGGSLSCEYARSIIEEILTDTLDVWNKDYYLTVTVQEQQQDQDVIPPLGEPCPITIEKITSSPCCILPTGAGPMRMNLDICG